MFGDEWGNRQWDGKKIELQNYLNKPQTWAKFKFQTVSIKAFFCFLNGKADWIAPY